MATNTQNVSHHANQLLPDSFDPGTIFAIYDGIVPLSRDCESFTIVAWDVPGGRRFRAELSDIECELVSEPNSVPSRWRRRCFDVVSPNGPKSCLCIEALALSRPTAGSATTTDAMTP